MAIKLSASRISTYLSCRQKYWFNYIKKVPKLSNPSFKLGTAVHESLELAGKIWLEKEKFSKEDTEAILELYDKVSVREGMSDYDIHTTGKDLIRKKLSSFMLGKKLIGLETKFGFWDDDGGPTVTSKYGVPLLGAIDRLEEYDSDTLIVVDYKTSKTAPTAEQMRSDLQLSIYDIVARQIYPQYKRVMLVLDMLKSEALYTYRTPEQREEFEKYLKVIYDDMLNLKEEDVRPTLDIFCPWCDYSSICSAYQKICQKGDYNFSPISQLDDEKLVEEWENVKATKKILENREREIGMVLMEKIKREAGNLKISDREVYVRQNSRVEYSLETVNQVVPAEDFPTLVNLNKSAIERYMATNPVVRERVLETATTNFTMPFLASRNLKKKEIIIPEED